MLFLKSDGGRHNAGFRGVEGDCVVRAICNATGLDYSPVYSACAAINAGWKFEPLLGSIESQCAIGGKRNCSNGVLVDSPAFRRYMSYLGFSLFSVPMDYRLPLESLWNEPGRHVLRLTRHATALVSGVLIDAWDCQLEPYVIANGVYEVWTLEA